MATSRNYFCAIEAAIDAGEIEIPEEYKKKQRRQSLSGKQSVADEIKKFKELLDSGALTQEEYDTQKKKLLNQ